jgi:ribonuclease P/MRP protein subunit RPP1
LVIDVVHADLCVRTGDAGKALEMGRQLGLDILGLIVPVGELAELEGFRKNLDWREKPRLALGTEVVSGRPGQLNKLVSGVRRTVEIVVARGGTAELNRAVVETPEVDILINHDIDGQCGINHVLARLAKKNGVAIGFDFNQLMSSYRLGRIQEFSCMVEAARQVSKARAPLVLTSGAQDPWDMRSPSELMAMGRQLGFSGTEIRKGLSDSMVRENRKRLSGKWVMPGVEVEG